MKAALLVSCLFVAVAGVGCKSDMEKMQDDICACADKKGDDAKKCMDDVTKTYKDKMDKGSGADAEKKMKDMSDKDKEAFGKAMACAMKAAGLGDK